MDSARAPVNLDKIISDFNVWEEAAAAVLQENNRLSLQVKHLQRQCTLYQEAEKCYINDITLLRCSTERLQNALAKRCDFENENAALRDQIVALHKSTVLLEMEHKKQIAESLDTLKAAHEAHKTELLRAQELVQRQSKQEIEVLQRQIQEKNAELRQIQKQLSDVERDRHTEVVKLRLEYDAKLLKLQKQRAQSDQPSSTNHEVYRKKLQHQKAESDQEIATLKAQVQDLQRQLATFGKKK
ncbi:hypothetical protein EMCRGX_G029495 [Ephydatia muelleri]